MSSCPSTSGFSDDANRFAAAASPLLRSLSRPGCFREARTYYKWQDKPVSETTLRALFDLMKDGADQCQLLALAADTSSPRPRRRRKREAGISLSGNGREDDDGAGHRDHSATIWPSTSATIFPASARPGRAAPHGCEGKPEADPQNGLSERHPAGRLSDVWPRASLGLDCGPDGGGFDNAGVEKNLLPGWPNQGKLSMQSSVTVMKAACSRGCRDSPSRMSGRDRFERLAWPCGGVRFARSGDRYGARCLRGLHPRRRRRRAARGRERPPHAAGPCRGA